MSDADPVDRDDAAYRTVAGLVEAGQLLEAVERLDQLAQEQRDSGAGPAEARTLRAAADLIRALGDTRGAVRRARRAVTAATGDPDERAASLLSLAEALDGVGDHLSAAASYADALAVEASAGFDGPATVAILRKQAAALAAVEPGRVHEAAAVLAVAERVADVAGDTAGKRAVLIDLATVLTDAGAEGWELALAAADEAVQAGGDAAARADVAMIRAAAALSSGDAVAARAAGEEARQASLEAVSPGGYVGASLTISAAADRLGDRHGAYAALATGWVTLGDLLGEEAARAVFEPPMIDLRTRWGDELFAAVKAEHDDRRRTALAD